MYVAASMVTETHRHTHKATTVTLVHASRVNNKITHALSYLYLFMDSKLSNDHQVWITLTVTADYLYRHTHMYMYMWKVKLSCSVHASANKLFTEIRVCLHVHYIVNHFHRRVIVSIMDPTRIMSVQSHNLPLN